MTNAERFRSIFGIYATELWAMSEPEFLKWLKAEAEALSVEPQRKKGEWIPQFPGFKDSYKCSACKKITVMPVKPYPRCPFCGTDMRGVDDDHPQRET